MREEIVKLHNSIGKYLIFSDISERSWRKIIANLEREKSDVLKVIRDSLLRLCELESLVKVQKLWHQKNADENAWWMCKLHGITKHTPDEYIVLRKACKTLHHDYKVWYATFKEAKAIARANHTKCSSEDVRKLQMDS